MSQKPEFTPFKHVPVGEKFTCAHGTFKKCDGRHVYRVNGNGASQTHAKIKFPRNTRCQRT